MLYGFSDRQQKDAISVISATAIKRLRGEEEVAVRIHSAVTRAIRSVRCAATVRRNCAPRNGTSPVGGRGVIIYLPQEGRGIGLIDKIKAYGLQDSGLDTAEANTRLGFAHDLRNYAAAAAIVRYCAIASVVLLTNNPDKVAQMEGYGVTVARRIPLRVGKNRYNRRYLQVKRREVSHDI